MTSFMTDHQNKLCTKTSTKLETLRSSFDE